MLPTSTDAAGIDVAGSEPDRPYHPNLSLYMRVVVTTGLAADVQEASQ